MCGAPLPLPEAIANNSDAARQQTRMPIGSKQTQREGRAPGERGGG